ncbi:mutS protein homolog 4-like [Biomphalaria glabrata]|uniref:MutS protein homolog 4-like n=2 Tax=Biomphalaria glabrata TaxID=6526 RepID=A0A9W3A9R4_BIOGL|nr:mutS protein homolog 4-like [Biomphalaria glabrata]
MTARNIQQPKYVFGILQTPSEDQQISRPTSAISSNSNSTGNRKKPLALPTPLHTVSHRPQTPGKSSTSYTPYTTTSTVSNENSSSAIVAIVEGRGQARGEVGISSLDLKQSILTLSQFSDSNTYEKTMAKLYHLNPLEILLPNTLCESVNNKLFIQLNINFPSIPKISVQRHYYNESKGLYYIKHLCASEYTNIELQISTKYYCLATTAALLKYVEFIQNMIFAPNSLKAEFRGCEHSTMIDSTTVKHLELLLNVKNPQNQHTLFKLLDYTKTPGGSRLLRSNLLQPPNNEETICLRQKAVMEFTEKGDVFYSMQTIISKFLDIGHIISVCVQIPKQETAKTADSKLNCVIMLKHVLELVPPLRDTLENCENELMKIYCKNLEDPRYDMILTKIKEVISDETHYEKNTLQQKIQKCFAVKKNIDALLDVARKTYSELIDDLHNIVTNLADQYKLPLRATYNSLRGFHIQMITTANSSDTLPPVFIKITKQKNRLNFTTMDLIQLNERIKESLDQVYKLTNGVITKLMTSIHGHISCMYSLADVVSMLDLLLSLAHAASISSYVCPEFTDTLAIKQGFHPILQKISPDTVVPNDTYASEHSNFVVITGPNMAGKSTYLRQVALLQIMAQIGSFVPAQYASFRITDQIFTRLGSDDDMESNSSTFTLEMKESNYILQNITDNSLVIIDELGRGTSAEEGIGICWAISENLLKTKAFIFFVTHFKQLTDLKRNYPNVVNNFFEVQRTFNASANHEKVSYSHILSKGITPETHYGLMLAEMSAIPSSITEDAKQIVQKLEKLKQWKETHNPILMKEHAVFNLATRLIQVAKNSRMDDYSLKVYLRSLQKAYLAEMQKINELSMLVESTDKEE